MKYNSFIYLFFTLFICSFSGFSQPIPFDKKFVDSMSIWLAKTPDNEEKVNNLVTLAGMHLFVNPALTIKYAKEGAVVAGKIKYYNGKINALGQSAFSFALSGEWVKATNDINEAIPLCEIYDPAGMIYMYNIMVIAYSIKGDHQQALQWAQKAVQQPEFAKQEELGKWPTYMQLGTIHEILNNLDSAKYYTGIIQKYIAKYASIQPDLTRDSYTLLGNLSNKLGEYDKALNYYRLAPNQIGLADVFHKTNQTDSAIYYGKIGLQNSQIHRIPINIQECAKILAEELKISDPKAAYEYLNIYINSKDSLYDIEKLKQGEEIKLNEQKNRYELQNIETASRNKMMMSIFSIVLCFISFISLLLWKNNRFKQKANTQLTTTLQELKSTQAQLIQSEKMASLGELTAGIAHEIQNPLNFVNNFSELSNELIVDMVDEVDKGNYDEVKAIAMDVQQNLTKINHHGKRASDIVKGMLEHSRKSTGEKELTDINALCDEYLRLAYHGLRAKDKSFHATLETKFDSTLPKIEIIPQDIGRVILNLINNAFYAVNERSKNGENGYQPTVSVSSERVDSPSGVGGERGKGDFIQISIKDNGSGIPEQIKDKIFQPFFTTKPTGQGTGLGLSLSYDIVKAHGGIITVDSQAEEGSTFTIQIPIS